MINSDNSNKYRKAKKRVAELKKFYTALLTYLIFMCFLAAVNYYVNEFRNPWFLWAAFGWGIGILFHAIKVFNVSPFLGRDWEDRKLQQFMDQEDRENDNLKF